VLPKSELVPFTVQASPIRGPAEHVDVVPNPPAPHTGHGTSTVGPVWTRDSRLMVVADVPSSLFAVPVTAPITWFMTHTDTPPDDSGNGAPKKNEQLPLPVQSPLVVQVMEVLPVQRWLLLAVPPAFSAGPSRLHCPQFGDDPAQPLTFRVSAPSLITLLSCDCPVHPVSRSAASPSASNCSDVGHPPAPGVGVAAGPVAVAVAAVVVAVLAAAVAVATCVAVGVVVSVAVMVGTAVNVGVAVTLGTAVAVAIGVAVGTGVTVTGVLVWAAVGVALGAGVAVRLGTRRRSRRALGFR
jgi:hypothetical protein